MSIMIERAVEATTEVHDLIEELNCVLGAAYEDHQRHVLFDRVTVRTARALLPGTAGRPRGRLWRRRDI